MTTGKTKRTVQELLDYAGIGTDGARPWDIRINNEEFYPRVLAGGSLALGESYMDGWWDCEAIDQFTDRILRAGLDTKVRDARQIIWCAIKAKIINQQSNSRARVVGKQHYDIGNDLYKKMLDKRMNYSCAYWRNAQTLDEAQEAKLDLICRKLNLKPDMTVLDIGSGWGGFSKFAAERYGVRVTGITISEQQMILARELCAGLDVEIRLQDYRDLQETYDRIVSIGMFEHVGAKNYRTYMEVVIRCLNPQGLFLLHTIGGNRSVHSLDPWLEKYIFPNSMIPSAQQSTRAYEGLFRLEDWHNFGTDYDKTLMAWHANFNSAWDSLKDRYDERFRRMWNYYLLTSAAAFRSHGNQLWQIVLAPLGSPVDYESIR